MEKEKLYPRIGKDKSWVKFNFRYADKHFTMRFSWKPMIMLEKYFIHYWGTKEDFMLIWKIANEWTSLLLDPDDKRLILLKKAMADIKKLYSVIDLCLEDNKSPFVIYVNEYNSYK